MRSRKVGKGEKRKNWYNCHVIEIKENSFTHGMVIKEKEKSLALLQRQKSIGHHYDGVVDAEATIN